MSTNLHDPDHQPERDQFEQQLSEESLETTRPFNSAELREAMQPLDSTPQEETPSEAAPPLDHLGQPHDDPGRPGVDSGQPLGDPHENPDAAPLDDPHEDPDAAPLEDPSEPAREDHEGQADALA